jgi:hypothetical protein
MLNALDISALVSGMRTPFSPVSRIIRILDDNSRWHIAVESGTASLLPTCSQSDVSLTRDQLIRWVCGRTGAEELVSEGVSGAECLSFFPKLPAFFFDMY